MSSRAGNIIEGEWLIDEAKKKIIEEYKTSDAIAEKIAVGAVKYSFLKVGLTQDVAFDFKESISLEGNSAPYLQYTFARIKSVLEKSKAAKGVKERVGVNTEEANILRTLIKYPEVIENAAKLSSPNLLANYLYDLAQKYNTFYNKHRIIASENEAFRLKLSQKTGEIIKDGLNILGIESPERM
jgi:arginyl-tRNA synthetase